MRGENHAHGWFLWPDGKMHSIREIVPSSANRQFLYGFLNLGAKWKRIFVFFLFIGHSILCALGFRSCLKTGGGI